MSARPCKLCGRMIVMAKDTETGKWIPLDTVSPCYKQTGDAEVVRDKKAFVTHFSTCVHASEFSKDKKAAPPPEKHFSEPDDG